MKTRMKVLSIAMLAGLTLAGTASAYNNMGGAYHHGQMQGVSMNQQLDQATQDKTNAFWASNQELRKEMIMKNAEKVALLNGTNPDPAAVAKITGELFDLRSTLQEKAAAAGVDTFMGHYAMGSGHGGRGHSNGAHHN